ncbi:MAG: (E)-4-hydroxy-3-methylbut-2-enyl-diphosphate synthase [Elusimicrobia bacterium]|nr:(E)-4-hydroxy-3-methylbut-2-enyl-diphosphate synthase [Elusimicrobiota bacterium]
MLVKRNPTRKVRAGSVYIGGGAPLAVQSMCATPTKDIDRTAAQAEKLRQAGAGLVRVAVDTDRDAEALKEIRRQTKANLVVDLQENYRLASVIAPCVDKIRYNPGHLHHVEKEKTMADKVRWIVDIAKDYGLALRIGVNCGSIAPEFLKQYPGDSSLAIVESAMFHVDLVEKSGFERFVVSLKDSDPLKVLDVNRRFAKSRPDIPLHLGVTEAGMPPEGIAKTRMAFEPLLSEGIGDTIRVSLTLPNDRKHEEVTAGFEIIKDVAEGRLTQKSVQSAGLNIISCPSCSRVENERFVELAQKIKAMTAYAKDRSITIAVMGCRVNGPGETDDADLGVWCGPQTVHLKRKGAELGVFSYEEILPRLKAELDRLIKS